ncbi:histidine kinase [Paenibacillus selenitireducens]|uniref:histidine kinase n=1 Tax=Paenibacillus selenitireducens TaxID=1324314 RepID=A0A1T2X1F8_9BACL|nr:sensor histidine kinase [Paenibacillus selenitireducens]OPA73709.1 histidine kinase [Paenibacillus selenitireducens]
MKNFKSIQFIITTSFILITVASVFIVSFMLYNKFSSTAEKNADLNIQQVVEQVNYNLEIYVKNMTSIFEVAQDLIHKSPTVSNPILVEQLKSIMKTREDLISIALFTKQGDLVFNIPELPMRKNTRLERQSWFESAVERPDTLSFSPPHIQNLFKNSYKWAVSISRQAAYREGASFPEGVLVVDMNFKTIDELSKQVVFGKKGYIYIIDSFGNIVYHPQQQLIHAGLKYEDLERVLTYSFGSFQDDSNGESKLITIKTVDPIGWKVVGVAYKDEILTTKTELNTFIFWFLVIIILFVLLLSIVVSARISLPIQNLAKSVKSVGEGDFKVPITRNGIYEVDQLSSRFNMMLRQIRQLMDQIIVEQEAKRKSELDVLQAQINPHFLYNTLNSVIRLAERGETEEVVTAITSLSRFFRISLSKGKNIISVEEEIEHVRHYLIIQKIRYKRKFQYVIDIEDEVLEYVTMKLILQPLVENAIVHGIEMMPEEGMIRIYVGIVDDKLMFQISDNGLGMSPQVLQRILTRDSKSEDGSGVGVKNVHQRIQLYFGHAYGLQFESELEEGTTVRIWLPLVRQAKEGE